MRKTITLNTLWLCLLSVFLTSDLSANHIVGGDVSYEFLFFSQNQTQVTFRVRFNMYRDLFQNGANFDNDAAFGIYQRQSDGSWDYYAEAIADPQDIDSIRYVDDPCLEERADVGVESAFYEFEVTLDIIDEDYMIAYQACCRNRTSNNIENVVVGSVFDVIITPEAQRSGNNCAVFSEYPPIFICVNYPLSVDVSATDAEGDDLTYSFCTPFQSGGGFSTGTNFCEYLEPPVDGCLPPFPTVTFVPPYTAAVPISGNPAITINPNTGILSGIPNVIGQFVVGVCIEERRNGVLLSRIRRDFQFNVVPCEKAIAATLLADETETQNGNIISVLKSCGDSIVEFKSSGQGAIVNAFEWNILHPDGSIFYKEEGSDLNDFSLTFNDLGEYLGYLVVNDGSECQDTAFFSVRRFPGVISEFAIEMDSCFPGPITFLDDSESEAGSVTQWQWNINGELQSNDRNVTYTFPDEGEKNIELITFDASGCSDTLQTTFKYNPPHDGTTADVRNETLCWGDSIFFDEQWLKVAGSYGDVLQYVETDCDSVGVQLNLDYWPSPQIIELDTMVCPGEIVTFFGTDYSTTGTYADIIKSVVHGCDSIVHALNLEIDIAPDLDFDNNKLVVAANTDYKLPFRVNNDFETIAWSPAIGLSCNDCPDPVLNGSIDTTYYVSAMTELGCLSKDSVYVDFIVVPESYFIPNILGGSDFQREDRSLFLQTLEEAEGSVLYDLQVMDRWGTLHFDGKGLKINDASEGWSTQNVLPGIYVYRFTIEEYFETIYEYGTITLLK